MRTWSVVLSGLTMLAFSAVVEAQEAGSDTRPARPREARQGRDAATRPAERREADSRPAQDRGGLQGEYRMMADVLGLTEAEQAKLKAAIDARQAALTEWDNGPEGKKLAELRTQAAQAAEAGDREKARELRNEIRALEEQRAKLAQEQMAKVMAVLSAEQRLKWEGFVLNRQMMQRFRRVGPTEEQRARIQALCDEAAKQTVALVGEEARREPIAKLAAQITETVLTAEQKAQLATRPAREQPEGDRTQRPGRPESDRPQRVPAEGADRPAQPRLDRPTDNME